MTKSEMVNYIMAVIEGTGCGYVGSNSYCETKKYYEKLSKAELYAEFRLFCEADSGYFDR